MDYLHQYTSQLSNKDLIDSIEKTSLDIHNNITRLFDFRGQLNGLLLGNVQSGKTAQMLGTISRLADDGYKLFILLTTDNIDLQRQTYTRVKSSLPGFTVISEKEEAVFEQEGLIKPIVIVLKKNSSILKRWRNILLNTEICYGLCLVIFDDEGDAASLNTAINRKKISTINSCLSEIKMTAVASIYIEVTATPQAIILQSIFSGWKPAFITYFEPGNGYLGGNFVYSLPKSYCAHFTKEFELDEIVTDDDNICPVGLKESIMSFLVVCAYTKIDERSNCNFMIHPSSRINIHDKFVTRVQEELNLLQQFYEEEAFDYNLKKAWIDLQKTKPDIPHYDDIKEKVIEILNNTELMVIPLNSRSFICRDSSNPDALDLSKGFNIIIGGNTLGRGITFPHLQIVYYCRTSKTPQADTFWQHSRIFGYDREKELIRIYIPQSLYKLFSELNESNEMIIRQAISSPENMQIIYPKHIKPTRKNVLDNRYLKIISGGVNIFASNPIENNASIIDNLISEYIGEESTVVDKDLILSILKHVGSHEIDDFDSLKFSSYISALYSKRPKIQYRLIIRTDREIAKGTGTMLSPNDRLLGDKYSDDVVLTLYRLNGSSEKGWNNKPFWIPNIKFPLNICFYETSN